MTITKQALLDLEADINEVLNEDRAEVHFTFHAAFERLNDARNNPAIALSELEDLFKEFIKAHLDKVLSFSEGTAFTIRCNKTNLHLPCGIVHDIKFGKTWVIQNVITIMRKQGFVSKDEIILDIN